MRLKIQLRKFKSKGSTSKIQDQRFKFEIRYSMDIHRHGQRGNLQRKSSEYAAL